MGSHLWPFQKWCVIEPTDEDQECARELLDGCRMVGLHDVHEMEASLLSLLVARRGATEVSADDKAIVKEFITSCYGELLYEIADTEDQVACLIAAYRVGQPLWPRDKLLGGAISPKGCAECKRTHADLVKDGHGPEPHPRPHLRHRLSRSAERIAETRAKADKDAAYSAAKWIERQIDDRFHEPLDTAEREERAALRRLAKELRRRAGE